MPGSIYWKDKSGIYRGCNDGLLTLIGFKSKKEVIGKNDYDLANHVGWDKTVAKAFSLDDQEVINTGVSKITSEEIPLTSMDGCIINQLTNKAPLYDGLGNIIGIVGVSLDITDWYWGKTKINILTLAIAYEGVAIPIYWCLLNKAGNATAIEHCAILKRFIRVFGKECILAC